MVPPRAQGGLARAARLDEASRRPRLGRLGGRCRPENRGDGGMDYLTTFTGKSGRLLRGTASRLWGLGGGGPGGGGEEEARQVESRDSLNSIALKFDTTPNELVQLNKLFSRAVVTGQVLYVPDPEYVSSVESSPSLSPISPLSPTSSEAEFDKTTTPDVVHPKEALPSSAVCSIRPSRVVSSTSEEEEAFTEKFLKINCKYITNGKGTVSGVLLVTPNNIMFDPHKTDPLVQENGCEEYGIMCPMEEVMSAAMYKDIVDSKIKGSLPTEIDQLSGRDVCRSKKGTGVGAEEVDSRTRDPGNDSASTAPRSTEESLSEDVFTESELSPIREELLSSELRQEKSSDASLESVQTVSQMEVQSLAAKSESAHIPDHINSNTGPSSEQGPLSHETDLSSLELAAKEGAKAPEKVEEVSGPKEQSTNVKGHDRDSLRNGNALQEGGDGSVASAETVGLKEKQTVEKDGQGSESKRDSEAEVEELRQLWKTHSMQQAKQQRDSVQQVSQKESKHKSSPADGHVDANSRWYRVILLITICCNRTEHLYAFFLQWSPEIYAEDTGEHSREPGFIVVKKMAEAETNEDPTGDDAGREWELTKHLPPRTIGYPWTLVYGTGKHGTSLKTLYRTMTGLDTPVLMVIKDSDGQVFGALASEPFKVSDGFYGTGETFVFTFCPEFEVFKWTGDNMFFIKGDMDSLAFGGGG
ncbi:oxidation resistance 1 [Cricetulus griseus]